MAQKPLKNPSGVLLNQDFEVKHTEPYVLFLNHWDKKMEIEEPTLQKLKENMMGYQLDK